MRNLLIAGINYRCLRRENILFIQRRHKSKKKMGGQPRTKPGTEHALEHFDMFYRPVYGNLWPSLRVALLSGKKYCAVLNNFTDTEEVETELKGNGAYNIIEKAQLSCDSEPTDYKMTDGVRLFPESGVTSFMDKVQEELRETYGTIPVEEDSAIKSCTSDLHSELNAIDTHRQLSEKQATEAYDDRQDIDHMNLHSFIPATQVYSDRELLRQEEASKSVLQLRHVDIDIVPCRKLSLPDMLKVFAYPQGDVTEYDSPRAAKSGGYLGYYLMDAASVLPVVALDLQRNENVLDLCAAPGGKTLSILQTLKTGNVVCNDLSYARIKRLKDVLRFYYPESDTLVLQKNDGTTINTPDTFDKVLVDVPCNTDRHVLTEDENNLFRPSRIQDRLNMPTLQKDLLMAGIRMCKPGGSVVYSTCTLSPAQNDGVIQQVFEETYQNTDIEIAVEDLSTIAFHFRDTFRFHTGARFGQLVLPSLSANFGPMYFCKINRKK